MKKILFFLTVILSINSYSQGDYTKIATSNTSEIWCKASTIKKTYGNEYKFWIKVTCIDATALTKERNELYGIYKDVAYKKYYYSMQCWYVKCNDDEIKTASYTDYDLNGNVIGSHDGKYSYENVVPESVGESIYNWVCNYVRN